MKLCGENITICAEKTYRSLYTEPLILSRKNHSKAIKLKPFTSNHGASTFHASPLGNRVEQYGSKTFIRREIITTIPTKQIVHLTCEAIEDQASMHVASRL